MTEKYRYGLLCEAFLRPDSGQTFADAISRLTNQEIASLGNAREDSKNLQIWTFRSSLIK